MWFVQICNSAGNVTPNYGCQLRRTVCLVGPKGYLTGEFRIQSLERLSR